MHNQDLGRVAVVARGTYDPSTAYERLDAVSYNGSSYLVRKHCQGVEPAEGEYYMLLAKAGDSTAANAAAAQALAAAEMANDSSGRADTAAENADNMATAAGAAADSANTAAGNANTAAAGASSAKQEAETAASGANAAAASANQKAEAAATATSAANAAASRADDAASGADTARDAAGAAAETANAAAAAAQDVVDSVQPDMAQVKKTLAAHGEALDNRIKKFYTGNLGAVNIADSDDGAVRNLVIGGRSEQISTNGYQLINLEDNPRYKGHDYSFDKETGTYLFTTISHKPNRWVLKVSPNSDITLSCREIADGVRCQISTYLQDQGQSIETHISSDRKIAHVNSGEFSEVTFSIYSQQDGEYSINAIMVEYGASAHDYEPYTGGAPSPSTDYPQEIKSVENCAMTVSNADGTETQEAAIPFSLHGNGDVRDELYVYADGAGKLVRRYPETLDPTRTVAEQALDTPVETTLTANQVNSLFDLRTYYGGTNVSFQSENGVEPVVNFDYACALENFVEYIKTAQGDDRKFIYDMDERMTDAEYVAALAYVNSEYATALTELEV